MGPALGVAAAKSVAPSGGEGWASGQEGPKRLVPLSMHPTPPLEQALALLQGPEAAGGGGEESPPQAAGKHHHPPLTIQGAHTRQGHSGVGEGDGAWAVWGSSGGTLTPSEAAVRKTNTLPGGLGKGLKMKRPLE